MPIDPTLSPPLQTHLERSLARLRAGLPALSAQDLDDPRLHRLLLVSDFALEVALRQPALLPGLLADDGAAPPAPPRLDPDQSGEWPGLLRRWRQAASVRLIWRDVNGLDTLEDTLAATSDLADACLRLALEALEGQFAQRLGVVRDAAGEAQRLVVFALGKLGGGELNFSSDIDLVLAYPHEDESDGARPLASQEYFARLGQQLAKLLDEVTAEGFCHRVDLRLRPFGAVGRIALSFAAMEQYFQREGRDWERYAWQKARPVAGDLAAGARFLDTLRPFVYRRYLDYGALDGLREMKASIAAEVARKDMADDIKRGPGGIREVEFLAQALQLIRGGREPALRERRLQPALRALAQGRHLAEDTAAALIAGYRFLRLLENRLQMLRDAQTQRLPEDALERARIAAGLGHADWPALLAALDAHRARIAVEFDALLAPRRRAAVDALGAALAGYWRALPDAGDPQVLVEAGFPADAGGDSAEAADRALRDFARAPAVRALSDAARARLDRVLPALLAAVAASPAPMLALRRLLAALHPMLRRVSYLALLDEQPQALERLIHVLVRSALLGERLAAHPLLLDELLDMRAAGPLPERAEIDAACAAAAQHEDSEAALLALNETRQAFAFRIGLATLDQRQPADASARQLAWLAEALVRSVLALARAQLHAQHGTPPGVAFAVIGYGSLGGEELGFGSDLDLVFLYDAPDDAQSDGARPLDAARWCARLAQKVVSLLDIPTAAGRLYEVDVRLRPDGAKGLLVTSLASFRDYQRQRAWTWEHQALVRARAVAGDAALCAAFEDIRAEILARVRDADALRADVAAMRARMRTELDRSSAAVFDLKQGEGGLVDLEFLLQALVLGESHAHPALLAPRRNAALIHAAQAAGLWDADTAAALLAAHAALLAAGLACTLDGRARLLPRAQCEAAAAAGIAAAYRTAIGARAPDAERETM
jgi:glutamate-ammonia-ligase adenylyltransferase